ncbi:hypothetical protein [Nocardia sp. NBC_00511]|uniref:hypothetical protein n=1 Tax=Nocardia sp. NBC_00511 TaxID=2903591 RepID=UPI0030E59B9E
MAPPKQHVHAQESRDCGRGRFDFSAREAREPLGYSKTLYQKMLDAQESRQTVPMLDITRAAGWSDEWDRMVDVWEHTDEAELNSRAQTPGYCWDGLPASAPDSDHPSDGFYLFVRDGRPVQFVRYQLSRYPIQLLRGVVVTKETVLTYQGSKLRPQ